MSIVARYVFAYSQYIYAKGIAIYELQWRLLSRYTGGIAQLLSRVFNLSVVHNE